MGRLGGQGVVGCRDQGLVNGREEVRPAQDLFPARDNSLVSSQRPREQQGRRRGQLTVLASAKQ